MQLAKFGPVACDSKFEAAFKSALAEPKPYWRNKNGDPLATGASGFGARVDVSAGPAWSFKDETKDLVYAHPVIDEDKFIYLQHRNGKVRKFSSDGDIVWTNSDFYLGPDERSLIGAPVLVDGALYMTDVKGNVVAVDASTGATRWKTQVGVSSGYDASSVAGLAGVIVAGVRSKDFFAMPDFGGADMIAALDAEDGKVLWRRKLPDMRYAENALISFADDPPSILFCDSFGDPYRMKLCDGEVVWSTPLPLEAGERPDFGTGGLAQGPNGLAYVTSNIIGAKGEHLGRLAAYRVSTGELAWSRRFDTQANNAPAVGRLHGSETLSVVVGLGMSAGPEIESLDAAAARLPGWQTEIAAFDAETGEPTGWRYTPPPHKATGSAGDSLVRPGHLCLPDAWSNAAIDADGAVYIGHLSGNLYGFRDVNGDGLLDEAAGEVKKYDGGRCYQASPGIADGMLVSTPCDGMHVFRATPS